MDIGKLKRAMKWRIAISQYESQIRRTCRLVDSKKLSQQQAQMIINLVIQGRNRYFTNAIPITRTETKRMDSSIATTMKHAVGLPQSVNNPFGFENSLGLGVTSSECVITQQYLGQALRDLNSHHPVIAGVAREGFERTCHTLAIGKYTLGQTKAHAAASRKNAWLRTNNALHRIGWQLRGTKTDPRKRVTDREIGEAMDYDETFRRIRPNLAARGWRWIGQLADDSGRRIRTWKSLTGLRSEGQRWFKELLTDITTDGITLNTPVGRLAPPMETPPLLSGDTVLWPRKTGNKRHPKFGIVIEVKGDLVEIQPLNQLMSHPSPQFTRKDHSSMVRWRGDPPLIRAHSRVLKRNNKLVKIRHAASITTATSTVGENSTQMFLVFNSTSLRTENDTIIIKGDNEFQDIMDLTDKIADAETETPANMLADSPITQTGQVNIEEKVDQITEDAYPDQWMIATDGSAKDQSLGAGAVLIHKHPHMKIADPHLILPI